MRMDGVTGEVWQRKLSPDPAEIDRWVSGLPGPVHVGYEAGPTGYGLSRYPAIMGSGARWRRRRSCSGRPGTG